MSKISQIITSTYPVHNGIWFDMLLDALKIFLKITFCHFRFQHMSSGHIQVLHRKAE